MLKTRGVQYFIVVICCWTNVITNYLSVLSVWYPLFLCGSCRHDSVSSFIKYRLLSYSHIYYHSLFICFSCLYTRHSFACVAARACSSLFLALTFRASFVREFCCLVVSLLILQLLWVVSTLVFHRFMHNSQAHCVPYLFFLSCRPSFSHDGVFCRNRCRYVVRFVQHLPTFSEAICISPRSCR